MFLSIGKILAGQQRAFAGMTMRFERKSVFVRRVSACRNAMLVHTRRADFRRLSSKAILLFRDNSLILQVTLNNHTEIQRASTAKLVDLNCIQK
jgi:hypothetical protein